jgi:hypothetical protein
MPDLGSPWIYQGRKKPEGSIFQMHRNFTLRRYVEYRDTDGTCW